MARLGRCRRFTPGPLRLACALHAEEGGGNRPEASQGNRPGALGALAVGPVDHPLQGGVDRLHLPQAAIVQARKDAGGALALYALLEFRLALLRDPSEIGLSVEELLQKRRPLAPQRVHQFATRPGVHVME